MHNETDERRRVSVTVTTADGDAIVDDAVTLDGGGKTAFENRVAMNQTVSLDVVVADGPSTTDEWDVSNTLHVRVRSDSIAVAQEE